MDVNPAGGPSDLPEADRSFRALMGAGTAEARFQALSGMVISLIREVTVLRAILEERGIVSPESRKERMVEAMLNDSNSAGMRSYRTWTWYPYLDGYEGTARRLGMDEEEIRKFLDEVDHLKSLT